MILNSPYISGSLTVTGNTNLIGSLTVTGSLAGTATSSSFAYTASSAVSAYTASSAVNATTALTASYANTFTVGGTLTAQTLVVQVITSSVDYVTGSTRFGSTLSNTHTFTGSLQVTGSSHTIYGATTFGSDLRVSNPISNNIYIGASSGDNLPKNLTWMYNNGQANSRSWRFTNDAVVYGDFAIQQSTTQTGTSFYNAFYISNNASTTISGSASSLFVLDSSDANGGYARFRRGGTDFGYIGSAYHLTTPAGANTDLALASTGNLIFNTGASLNTRMFISASGLVGINTITPTVALEFGTAVAGANRVLLKPTTDYAFYQINHSGGTTYIGTDNSTGAVFGNGNYATSIYNSYSGNINFYTAAALRMMITSNGNVGINTATPTGSGAFNGMHIAGSSAILRVGPWFSSNDRDFIELRADGANTNVYSVNEDFSFWNPGGNANITGSVVNICSAGNINLRTTAGASNTLNIYAANATGANSAIYMECPGQVGAGFYVDRATSTFRGWCGVSTQGVSLANSATSWGTFSDERMKDIIEPITNAVDKVNTLRTVIGKYKTDDPDKRRPFLIAQDVQAVLPEAVYDDKSEDKYLSLAYTDVIPLLVASIKELKAELDELKNK